MSTINFYTVSGLKINFSVLEPAGITLVPRIRVCPSAVSLDLCSLHLQLTKDSNF